MMFSQDLIRTTPSNKPTAHISYGILDVLLWLDKDIVMNMN